MALWVVLSGRFDTFHLTLGVISCALVSFFSGDLLFPHSPHPRLTLRLWWRFPLYVPWLLYQIFLANLHLLYLTFHPRMPELIDPHMVRFPQQTKKRDGPVGLCQLHNPDPGHHNRPGEHGR